MYDDPQLDAELERARHEHLPSIPLPTGAAKLEALAPDTPEQRAARIAYDQSVADELGISITRLAWGKDWSIIQYDRTTSDPYRRRVSETPRGTWQAQVSTNVDVRRGTTRQHRSQQDRPSASGTRAGP